MNRAPHLDSSSSSYLKQCHSGSGDFCCPSLVAHVKTVIVWSFAKQGTSGCRLEEEEGRLGQRDGSCMWSQARVRPGQDGCGMV